MTTPRSTTIRSAAAALSAGAASFVLAAAAHAQVGSDSTGLNATAGAAGLLGSGPSSPETIIANIISGVLGFIGVLFLVLMIYAGFLWMTAQGEEKKVTQARQIIVGAVIGVVVVFSAYAITQFVLTSVIGSTSSPQGTTGPSEFDRSPMPTTP
jgi:hypothetical protein